ncbi:MAG: hypothetical protein PHP98_09005 [Kiritimatiellae bacterium]|jgi:hypothetical protein|nr:hypothetical protein [Kiritimatiellia bacterium]
MGSGCANTELTHAGKKPREKKRRIKSQTKRLLALGVPENVVRKLNAKEIRQMLARPLVTKKRWAKKQ